MSPSAGEKLAPAAADRIVHHGRHMEFGGKSGRVELLWEHSKAVISEAVTKGHDPDVPMKDSGIDLQTYRSSCG